MKRLKQENKKLREVLKKISNRSCGGYVMYSQGYVNGCGCPELAKESLK